MRLTKHHGLGNDFLILLDLEGRWPLDEGLARRLCNRHRGVGADGLIRVTKGTTGAEVAMELRNADGGRAEMSGNGIRCLGQAVVDAGVAEEGTLRVATDVGVRRLVVGPERQPGVRTVAVEMGPVRVDPQGLPPFLGPELDSRGSDGGIGERGLFAGDALADALSAFVDVGNPHLVLIVPSPEEVDVATIGSRIDRGYPGGLNIEVVGKGPGPDELTMSVWERGVGITEACGTGACAAAAVAFERGLVGERVTVHQPGGDAVVELRPDTAVLIGPAHYIATVEVPIA